MNRLPTPGSATVAIAMSGGVDSSVTAALLLEKGYRVFGATMKLWRRAETSAHARSCCSLSAIDEARAMARSIGIPHHVIDLENVFEDRVVAPFCLDYCRGRTPNPCVLCNTEVKFKALMDRVVSLGADFLATGHYAIIEGEGAFEAHGASNADDTSDAPVASGTGRGSAGAHRARRLRRAGDRTKDQSYVLWGIDRERLARILFPLGRLTKQEVRGLASRLGLCSANTKESQDVCFINSEACGVFVAAKLSEMGITVSPGNITDVSGKLLGSHRGLVHFTIGQRRGLGISSAGRRYVVGLKPESNTVVLGGKDDLLARELVCSGVNWLTSTEVRFPLRALVQIRYTHVPAAASIERGREGTLKVVFDEAQSAITPGQSAVFYDGDTVMGGGIIEEVGKGRSPGGH